MATKIEQDAQDLPAALSEIMHFQQTESDRMAEFEEATARARQAARNDPAKTDTEQPEGEGSKRALTGHEAYSDSPEPREDAKNGGEDIIPPNSEQDATPVRVQAPWISDAVSACQTNKKVCSIIVGSYSQPMLTWPESTKHRQRSRYLGRGDSRHILFD